MLGIGIVEEKQRVKQKIQRDKNLRDLDLLRNI